MSREKLTEALTTLGWSERQTFLLEEIEQLFNVYRKLLNQHPQSKWRSALRKMEVGDTISSDRDAKHMAAIICLYRKRDKALDKKFKTVTHYEGGVFKNTVIERIK
jgi:hypothetical protein